MRRVRLLALHAVVVSASAAAAAWIGWALAGLIRESPPGPLHKPPEGPGTYVIGEGDSNWTWVQSNAEGTVTISAPDGTLSDTERAQIAAVDQGGDDSLDRRVDSLEQRLKALEHQAALRDSIPAAKPYAPPTPYVKSPDSGVAWT